MRGEDNPFLLGALECLFSGAMFVSFREDRFQPYFDLGNLPNIGSWKCVGPVTSCKQQGIFQRLCYACGNTCPRQGVFVLWTLVAYYCCLQKSWKSMVCKFGLQGELCENFHSKFFSFTQVTQVQDINIHPRRISRIEPENDGLEDDFSSCRMVILRFLPPPFIFPPQEIYRRCLWVFEVTTWKTSCC